MESLKALVYLEHEVESFTVYDSQLAYITHKFPYLKFKKASTIDEV
jgi:hypothetical protein